MPSKRSTLYEELKVISEHLESNVELRRAFHLIKPGPAPLRVLLSFVAWCLGDEKCRSKFLDLYRNHKRKFVLSTWPKLLDTIREAQELAKELGIELPVAPGKMIKEEEVPVKPTAITVEILPIKIPLLPVSKEELDKIRQELEEELERDSKALPLLNALKGGKLIAYRINDKGYIFININTKRIYVKPKGWKFSSTVRFPIDIGTLNEILNEISSRQVGEITLEKFKKILEDIAKRKGKTVLDRIARSKSALAVLYNFVLKLGK